MVGVFRINDIVEPAFASVRELHRTLRLEPVQVNHPDHLPHLFGAERLQQIIRRAKAVALVGIIVTRCREDDADLVVHLADFLRCHYARDASHENVEENDIVHPGLKVIEDALSARKGPHIVHRIAELIEHLIEFCPQVLHVLPAVIRNCNPHKYSLPFLSITNINASIIANIDPCRNTEGVFSLLFLRKK